MSFSPAWWVPGRHLQTLWGKLARPWPPLPTRRERWETPDGDFVDLVRLDPPGEAAAAAPRVLLLHGLEGSPRSHYVGGVFAEAARRGWGADLLVFRSCGEEPNRLERFYHSGETEDPAFVVARIAGERPGVPLALAGVSLGGNVLLKLLGEAGAGARGLPSEVRAAGTISVPYDLARGSRHIDRGFSRVYQAWFLRTLRAKAREKLARYPGLFDAAALERARTLWDFDDVVTAPVHGFASAVEYYARASSIGFLADVRVPTLLLSAVDDPFLPPAVLDEVRRIAARNPALTLEFVARGGHVGFVGGRVPWRPRYWAEARLGEFFARRLGERGAASAA